MDSRLVIGSVIAVVLFVGLVFFFQEVSKSQVDEVCSKCLSTMADVDEYCDRRDASSLGMVVPSPSVPFDSG